MAGIGHLVTAEAPAQCRDAPWGVSEAEQSAPQATTFLGHRTPGIHYQGVRPMRQPTSIRPSSSWLTCSLIRSGR
jgi:hypothetical protein